MSWVQWIRVLNLPKVVGIFARAVGGVRNASMLPQKNSASVTSIVGNLFISKKEKKH